jgi:hypothetical protein
MRKSVVYLFYLIFVFIKVLIIILFRVVVVKELCGGSEQEIFVLRKPSLLDLIIYNPIVD